MWDLKDRKLSSEALWCKVETTKKWCDSSNTSWKLLENLSENDIESIIDDIKRNPNRISQIFDEKIKWFVDKGFEEHLYRELENLLLEKEPHLVLEHLDKFPWDLLNDENYLKKLDAKILWDEFKISDYDIRFLDRLIEVDPEIFEKVADKAINQWDFKIIFIKINYLEKIKAIIEKEEKKWNKGRTIYDEIVYRVGWISIDLEKLAQLFQEKWQDIGKYPKTFWNILNKDNPDYINTILKRYTRAQERPDWYLVYKKEGSYDLYGFLDKNGKTIVPCQYEYQGVYKQLEKLKSPEGKLIAETEKLEEEWHITDLSFYPNWNINQSVFVELPNGKKWMAISIETQDEARNKNVEILDENGKHLMFIKWPEWTTNTVLATNQDLYIGSYWKDTAYLTAYNMWDFSKKWQIKIDNQKISSMSINENEIIVDDIEGKKITHFDKTNGEKIIDENVHIDEKMNENSYTRRIEHGNSCINLSVIKLIESIPLLESGIRNGMKDFNDKYDIFSKEIFDKIVEPQIQEFPLNSILGFLNGLTVDQKNWRAYLAIRPQHGDDYKIGVFDINGFLGMIPYNHIIRNLDFDEQTDSLIISGSKGWLWNVKIFDSYAINTMVK